MPPIDRQRWDLAVDQQDDQAPRGKARGRSVSSGAAPYGVSGSQAPDYRAIARQFASLSAAAARQARATGDEELDRLARRLDDCADAILDDLDRERARLSA